MIRFILIITFLPSISFSQTLDWSSSNVYLESNIRVLQNRTSIPWSSNLLKDRLDNLKGNIRQLTYTWHREPLKGCKFDCEGGYAYVFNKNRIITGEWTFHNEKQVKSKLDYRDYKKSEIDKELYYDKKGDLRVINKYIYDTLGKLLRIDIERIKGVDDIVLLKRSMNRDTVIIEYPNDFLMKFVNGRQVYFELFNSHGKPDVRLQIFYEGDKLKKTISYSKKRKLQSLFNKKGYVIDNKQWVLVGKEYALYLHTKYQYNDLNKIIAEDNLYRISGKENHVIKKYFYKGLYLVKTMDGKGKILKEVTYSNKGDALFIHEGWNRKKYVYLEFDHKGNWTKRQLIMTGKIIETQNRKLEYY